MTGTGGAPPRGREPRPYSTGVQAVQALAPHPGSQHLHSNQPSEPAPIQGTATKPGPRAESPPARTAHLHTAATSRGAGAPQQPLLGEAEAKDPVAKTRQHLWACSLLAQNGSPDNPSRKGHRQDKWETRKGHDVPGHPSKMTALLFTLDPERQGIKRHR